MFLTDNQNESKLKTYRPPPAIHCRSKALPRQGTQWGWSWYGWPGQNDAGLTCFVLRQLNNPASTEVTHRWRRLTPSVSRLCCCRLRTGKFTDSDETGRSCPRSRPRRRDGVDQRLLFPSRTGEGEGLASSPGTHISTVPNIEQ